VQWVTASHAPTLLISNLRITLSATASGCCFVGDDIVKMISTQPVGSVRNQGRTVVWWLKVGLVRKLQALPKTSAQPI